MGIDLKRLNLIPLSPYFYLSEFQCPCCKRVILDGSLWFAVSELRDEIQTWIKITSGYRCPYHNLMVGGASRSYHLYGQAIDCKFDKFVSDISIELLKGCGFTGIFYYPKQRRWHLDIRPGKLLINLEYV